MIKKIWSTVFAIMFLTQGSFASVDANSKETIKLITKEQSLGKVRAGIMFETIALSPNNRRIAYASLRLNTKAIVVVDGVESPEYDDVDNFVFSSDSNRFAYASFSAGKWSAVIDGTKQKEYERLGAKTIRFSPDNKRFCYMVWEPSKNRQFVVVDGIEGEEYVGIFVDFPIFSADSKKVIFGAKKGNKHVMVVNGKADQAYDAIAGTVVSADGQHLAYTGRRWGSWRIIVDGNESEEKYDGIYEDGIVFSPDGKKLAYAASKNGKGFVVIDGIRGKDYDVIDNNSIMFSLDSKRFAYRAIKGKKQLYVVDGNESDVYDGVGRDTLVFSRDNKHTAYMAMDDNRDCIVLDNQVGKKYDMVTPPVFNPAEYSVAYCAKQNDKWFFVNNGEKEIKSVDAVDIPVFSSDGKHIVFRAKRGQKQLVITDGKESKEYDEISQSSLMFTPDSCHVVYLAQENEKNYVVVDDSKSKGYDAILQKGTFGFNSSSSFNFIAAHDREFIAVDIHIVETQD